jgi:ABC-type nickel/cobalt efflux system permease component RcnA
MYCSTCGVAVVQGLSYCNYCGAKSSGAKGDGLGKSSEVKPESLLWGMIAVLVFGLVAIVFLMMAMKMVGLNVGQILAFTILSFLIMLLVEGVFIWQLLHRKRGAEERGDTALSKEQATKELDTAQARVLPEAMPSVTEHTTRTFEPLYRERKSE